MTIMRFEGYATLQIGCVVLALEEADAELLAKSLRPAVGFVVSRAHARGREIPLAHTINF